MISIKDHVFGCLFIGQTVAFVQLADDGPVARAGIDRDVEPRLTAAMQEYGG
jgi:hypothetical protein